MQNNSFMEDDEFEQPHCLGVEVGAQNIGDWRGNSQERVETPSDPEIDYFTQFNINDNMINQVVQSFFKQNQCTQIIESLTAVVQDRNDQIDKQKTISQVNDISQAETFYDNTNINSTITRDSMIEQNYKVENTTILNDFFSLYKYNYDPLISHFAIILAKVQAYSDQSIASLDMYCLFFRIKQQQESLRKKQLKSHIRITKPSITNNKLLESVYIDENVIVQQIQKVMQQKIHKIDNYCEQLMQISNKFQIILQKAINNRKSKLQQLKAQLERIKRIEKELIDSINQLPKVNGQNKENSINLENIRSDRYLQRKYLVEREKLFLELIKNMGEKIVGLLNSIFMKEEPIICAIINRQMIRYTKICESLYGKMKEKHPLAKINHADMMNDLFQALYEIIPHESLGSYLVVNDNNPDTILSHFNSYLQEQLYLPSFEINQEHILFALTAKWHPKNHQEATFLSSTDKPLQNEQPNLVKESQGTYKTLITDRVTEKRVQLMDVSIILTIDRFLHLQCGQKIATLKLKKLKLTKKGNNILVYQKNKGITNLFSHSSLLGTIMFKDEDQANKLITGVHEG